MVSVTQRIKEIKQPYGGYLRPSMMDKVQLVNKEELYPDENLHPTKIGLVVDYLSRFMSNGHSVDDAFRISIKGLDALKLYATQYEKIRVTYGDLIEQADEVLLNIKGLDDKSIISACQITTFDSIYRAGLAWFNYETLDDERLIPDAHTIANIRIMVNRALEFFDTYGPVTKDGFKFIGGYTDTITAGDGDFLTEDTLWDFKVSKKPPLKEHTLQLLIYYLMGKHSVQPYYESLTKIGLYNPRLNMVYTKKVSDIDKNILDEIASKVIGYD